MPASLIFVCVSTMETKERSSRIERVVNSYSPEKLDKVDSRMRIYIFNKVQKNEFPSDSYMAFYWMVRSRIENKYPKLPEEKQGYKHADNCKLVA